MVVRLLEGVPAAGEDAFADSLLTHVLTDYHAQDGPALFTAWLFRLWVREQLGGAAAAQAGVRGGSGQGRAVRAGRGRGLSAPVL